MSTNVKVDIKYNCSHSIQNRQGGLNWFLTLLNVIYKWRCQTWTKEIWFGCIWMWPPTRINCEIWFATETCFQANLKWFCIELPFAHKSQLKNHPTCTCTIRTYIFYLHVNISGIKFLPQHLTIFQVFLLPFFKVFNYLPSSHSSPRSDATTGRCVSFGRW